MAEDKFEPREGGLRQWLPWAVLFRGFEVARDPKKLLLAAAGILVMAFGWWLLAFVAYELRKKPDWGEYSQQWASYQPSETAEPNEDKRKKLGVENAWRAFKRDRRAYNLMYKAAAPSVATHTAATRTDAGDLADTPGEFEKIDKLLKSDAALQEGRKEFEIDGRRLRVQPKPAGQLRTLPWFEDRGPNPMLLLAGKAGNEDAEGRARRVPWEAGHFWDWLLGVQVPVLVEPLRKLTLPIASLLHPDATWKETCYFLLVTFWTLATWSVFGGAITRMAAVQVARNEKIGLGEAFRFVWSRRLSYLLASLAPVLILGGIALLLFLIGIGNLIPVFAELWNVFLWPVVLVLGLGMALALVGLVGWPMIHATLSAEGSDSFDALSRSYSYVFQGPWQYLWYSAVALVYGAVVVFFISLMGSLTIYLSKWGVTNTSSATFTSRDPSYMFLWAPTSYEWRELLTKGPGDRFLVRDGELQPTVELNWWNYIGLFCMTIWVYVVFLAVIGFGYSYFWSACTIIYLLMRRKVDDTELDEVYLEEEEPEDTYTTAATTTPAPPPGGGGTLQMVETPALRPAPALAPTPAPSPAPAPAGEVAVSPPAATPVKTEPSSSDGGSPSTPPGPS